MKHTYHFRGLLRRVAGLLSLLALAAPRAQAQSAIYYTQGSSTATLDALKAVAPAGGTSASLAAGSANFSQPTDVVVDAAGGFVYVADQYVGTGAIYRYKTDGSGRTTVVNGTAGVTYNGLALDAAGQKLYYTQAGATASQAAVKVASLTGPLPAAGTGVTTLPGTFLRPGDLALNAAAGVLYVADQYTGSGSIVRIVLSTGATTTLVTGTANATYNGLALDAANNRIYFTQGSADAAADALKVLNLSTSVVTTLTSGSAQFSQPTDLAFDPVAGQLYLTDQYVGTGALLRYTVGAGGTTVSGRTALVTATAGAAYGGLALALNQAPVLAASSGTVTAPEQVATIIDAGIIVADADNSTLASGTVSITSGLVSAEDILTFTANATTFGNIVGSYSASTGVLALTSAGATATLAQWQAALRSVTYTNASNTPTTTARTVSFVVNDGMQNSNVATRTLNVQAVNDAPVNTVPGAQTTPYNTALTFSTANGNAVLVSDVDGGTAAEQVTLTASNGTLTLGSTTGLTFSAGTGTANATMTFSGTLTNLNAALSGLRFQPTAGFAGAASVQLVTNDLGNTGTGGALTATNTIAITVGAATLAIAPSTLPGSTVGAAYSQTFTTSGGTGPYTYALVAGSGALPAGLTLTAGGVLSGTPTASGPFSFSIRSTDSSTGTGPSSVTQAYTLNVAAPTLSIVPATLPNGTAGAAYSQTLTTSGGVSPYSYTLASGTLPAGLTLATSGVLSGTPTASGSFVFSVRTTDASTGTGPATTTQGYTLTINAPTIALMPTSLPGGTVGTVYSQTITASGGVASYTYLVANGNLPTGLTLSSAGVLSGTPTTSNSFSFTVTARDAAGFTGSQAYTVTIAAPATISWTGAVSTDWFTADNWSPAVVPGAGSNVFIATVSSGNYPLIASGTATSRALTLSSGGILTMSGGMLDAQGQWTNNGTFAATGGTVQLGGQTGSIVGSSTTTFWNLTTSGNAVDLNTSAGLAVRRLLTTTTSLNTNGNLLTLLSDVNGTAMAVNPSSGIGVTGSSVAVQRYIGPATYAGAGYRHLASPTVSVSSTQGTMFSDLATASFTPQVNPTYNTAAAPGSTQPYPTIFGYDQSRLATVSNNVNAFDKGYYSPASTSDRLSSGLGYTVNLAANQAVTFRGQLGYGDLARSLSRNAAGTPNDASAGWQLLGNPYPSPYDYSKQAAADRPNLDAAIYVFMATGQYAGQYRTVLGSIGDPILPLGQAFFARISQGQTSGTIIYRNANRVTTYQNPTYQRSASTQPLVQLTLQGTGSPLLDEVHVYFAVGATSGVEPEYDAVKLPNPTGLNLATRAPAGQQLAIDGQPELGSTSRVVPLTLGVPAAGSYTLAAAQLLNLSSVPVYLRDLLSGAVVDLHQQASYQFTVSNAAAPVQGRFELVFSPQQTLAVVPAALAQQVGLYPNPAKTQLTLELPLGLSRQPVTATLVDALGRVVHTVSLPAGPALHQLPLQDVATGVYSLRLATELGVVVRRLTVE